MKIVRQATARRLPRPARILLSPRSLTRQRSAFSGQLRSREHPPPGTRLRLRYVSRTKGSKMRRVVPVALLALAALQIGTLSAAVVHCPCQGSAAPRISRRERSRAPVTSMRSPASEFVDSFPCSAPRTRVVYPEYPERSRGIVMIVPVAPEAPSGRPSRRASAPDLHGLSDWVRSLAGALATEGFIAVAPDLLAGVTREGIGSASSASAWPRSHERTGWLRALRAQAPDLPAAVGPVAWPGSVGAVRCSPPGDQPQWILVVFQAMLQRRSDYRRITPRCSTLSGGRASDGESRIPAVRWRSLRSARPPGVTLFLKTSTACTRSCEFDRAGRPHLRT